MVTQALLLQIMHVGNLCMYRVHCCNHNIASAPVLNAKVGYVSYIATTKSKLITPCLQVL
jgi:hypothetical protein